MKENQTIPIFSSARSLWSRAPAWRFSSMMAALLSLIFILFPPLDRKETSKKNIPDLATYTPRHGLNTKPDQNGPAINTQNNQPAFGKTASKPQSANLSMATPGATSAEEKETGLDRALFGKLYSGSIQVNGFKLPLPDGNWVLLASQTINNKTSSGTDYYFGRIVNKQLHGAVMAYALRPKPGSEIDEKEALVKSCGCDRKNVLHASMDSAVSALPSCWYIYNYYAAADKKWADKTVPLNGLTRAAAGDLAAKGVDYPQDLIAVQFVRNEPWGLLYANYLFSPESEGITSKIAPTYVDSDWFHTNISRFPEKLAYVEKYKHWAQSMWPVFKEAFESGK